MMRSNLYLCALSIAALVVGKDVPNPQVRATRVEEATPASLITPAPLLHGDIFKRSIATCGFIRGNSALPVTCAEDYNCITTKRFGSFTELGFACCNNVECLHNWATCRSYGQTDCMGYALADDACSSVLGSILQCSRESQRCVRYARSSALGATNTYYSWACGTTSDDILMLATVTNGAFQTPHSDPTGIEELLRSFTDASLPTAASNNPPVGGGGGGSSNPISNTAIALISVAGIGVIAIALLIGYFCWWRRRYNENTGIVQQTKPSHLPYEPTVTQGPPTEYIPSWSGGIPLGASPNQPPSEPARSEYSGPTANGRFWPMSTVHEQGSSAGHRFY